MKKSNLINNSSFSNEKRMFLKLIIQKILTNITDNIR